MSASPSLDRSQLETEKRLASAAGIDALTVAQTLALINTQDVEVPRALRQALPALTHLIEAILRGMRQGGRLLYVGAGTSGRLGVLDASECPPTFHTDPGLVVGLIAGGDRALRRSAEGMEDDFAGSHAELDALKLAEHDSLVGIAAGGTTPYVWGAIDYARQRGSATGLLTCVRLSALRKPVKRAALVAGNAAVDLPPPPEDVYRVDHPVELLVGPELIAGSTRLKAGTATKLALNMISTTVMVQQGKTWGNLMVDLRATNAKLRDRALRILEQQLGLDRAEATQVLAAADGRVKLALVMHRKQLDAQAALTLIDQHGGRLRPILGSPR